MAPQLLYLPTEPGMMRTASDPTLAADGLLTQSLRRLLEIICLLWMLYFGLLLLIDQSFIALRSGTVGLPGLYYAAHGTVPVTVLVLLRWPRLQYRLAKAFLPLVIGAIAVAPVLIDWLVLPTASVGPIIARSGLLSLRLAPLMCVGLVLMAWFYPWRYVVGYVFGTAALLALANLHNPAFSALIGALILQILAQLQFGYCISLLIARLNAQRLELLEANSRLQDFAATQERLTISHERNRVARELHDTLAHTLSGLTVQMETMKAYWDVDQSTTRTMLDTALATSRNGLDETRRALAALRVSPLDDLGLALALQTLAESAAAAANLRLFLTLPEAMPTLPPATEQGLYRITQEAIANAVTHAQATTLTISLSAHNQTLTLSIQDDGRGFDDHRAAPVGHYGIAGMRERAALLGGHFTLTTTPTGTTIRLTLSF